MEREIPHCVLGGRKSEEGNECEWELCCLQNVQSGGDSLNRPLRRHCSNTNERGDGDTPRQHHPLPVGKTQIQKTLHHILTGHRACHCCRLSRCQKPDCPNGNGHGTKGLTEGQMGIGHVQILPRKPRVGKRARHGEIDQKRCPQCYYCLRCKIHICLPHLLLPVPLNLSGLHQSGVKVNVVGHNHTPHQPESLVRGLRGVGHSGYEQTIHDVGPLGSAHHEIGPKTDRHDQNQKSKKVFQILHSQQTDEQKHPTVYQPNHHTHPQREPS
mmetsp:Transcript_16290/g.33049  ORF Transcript_16290/g.33049 Transcript_16290/m.33049 type:complete len:270 (-) Transcript_16290:824-1633(-)